MENPRLLLRSALLTATSCVALAIALPAVAQDAPKPPASDATAVKEVIVTGFRASLQSALDAKRRSNLPIESVAPEDIGKMPDQNVAEALQRLPGVQIDRSQGQGTAVLIDGLRQNLTTLNGDVFLTGKEFYVSGEASNGGAGANSQYNSLEGIPSEEVGRIDVYKNPQASMTEGGIGGTIDLRTRDPLASPLGLTVGGNFRETAADGESGSTPNATLVGSYKVDSNLAFTGSVSYDDENTHTKEYQDQNRNQWTITNAATGPYVGALTVADVGTLPSSAPNGGHYILPQLGYFSDIFDQRKTLGAAFGVAWKVTDALRVDFNYFYSHEDDVSTTYSDKLWFNGGATTPPAGIDPTQPYAISANGVIESATINAQGAETATLYQHDISEANNFQLKTRWDDGGPLKGLLDFSYARATSNLQADQADIEHGLYYAEGAPTNPTAPGCNNGCLNGTGNHGYEFNYSNGGTSGLPSATYLAPFANVLNDPAYTLFKSNWAWANLTTQQQYALRAEGSYDVPFLKSVDGRISFGLRFGTRDVDQTFGRYLIADTLDGLGAVSGNYLYYQDPGYTTPNIPYSTAASNPGLVKVVNNFAVGNIIVKNPGTGGMTNPSTYLETVWGGAGVPNTTEKFFEDTLSSFQVNERTTAGFAMLDLGNRESRFHINFGVRIVGTDLTIDGAQTNPQGPTYVGTASWNGVNANNVAITTKRSYTDVLPSFNAVFDITDTQLVRFGAARVVAPQDLFSLGLGNTYNFTRQIGGRVNTNPKSAFFGQEDGFAFDGGTSGNPNLDPYRATQSLASYENYFAKGGIIAVGAFYKAIDNFVETQNLATTVMDDFGGSTATVSKPVNAGAGTIWGLELSAQYAFGEKISPWLDGFGVAGNYTRSNSTSDQVTSFSSHASIPGVAKNSLTTTLYYEKYGFSARLAYSWRDVAVNDSLVGATFAPGTTTYQIFAAPYGQLDGQVSYDINKHVGVVFSVQNITDAVQHTYLQWANEPFTYDDSGSRFFLGVKFKN